jgi:hypothetical protein
MLSFKGEVVKRKLLAILLLILPNIANAQSWATQDAKLTTEEFLQMYLESQMGRHENSTALNSFNFVTFLPGANKSSAIVFLVQTYAVGRRTSEDPAVRRELRKVADAELSSFESRFNNPILNRRWSPSRPRNQDVLAVTVLGETSFEAEKTMEAAALVKAAGGLWSW